MTGWSDFVKSFAFWKTEDATDVPQIPQRPVRKPVSRPAGSNPAGGLKKPTPPRPRKAPDAVLDAINEAEKHEEQERLKRKAVVIDNDEGEENHSEGEEGTEVRKPVPEPSKPESRAVEVKRDRAIANFAKNERTQSANLVPVPASEEEAEIIDKFKGLVLTAGVYPLSEAAKENCAFLDNGYFLINRNNAGNARVVNARSKIMAAGGREITKTLLVSMTQIRKLYEMHERTHGSQKSALEITEIKGLEAQAYQKDVLHLIERAYGMKVSDIHVFVRQNITEVKFRINGELEAIMEKPSSWGHQLCSTAYSMSAASDSTYLRNEYQGSRIASNDMPLTPGVQSIRVQQNPLPDGGRYMVCRLLLEGGRGDTVTLSQLGYNKVHVRDINTMRRQAEGVIIIAGPTGSGKSTTLVIVINNDMKENPGRNVITVEDPPEFIIAGAAQFSVTNANDEASKKKAFQKALNAALRSDPDTIMIGEIRDEASAGLAFKAAQTGHRVYASLHATNAVSILGRLREINVPLYNLTEPSLVAGLIGQRLVRRLCPHCRIPLARATSEQLAQDSMDADLIKKCEEIMEAASPTAQKFGLPTDGIFITNHKGCEHCRRGIAGRSVVSETITPELDFMMAIKGGSTTDAVEIWKKFHDGITMHEHGLQRMVSGISAPRDIIAMTGDIMKFDMGRSERIFGELMLP